MNRATATTPNPAIETRRAALMESIGRLEGQYALALRLAQDAGAWFRESSRAFDRALKDKDPAERSRTMAINSVAQEAVSDAEGVRFRLELRLERLRRELAELEDF